MLYVGVDTGGTFTDLVLMEESGRISTAKTLTTPGALEECFLTGLALLAEQRGQSLEEFLPDVARIGYGTTQATNALIERKGVETALVTTMGFADSLLIQRLMGFATSVPKTQLGWYSKRRYPTPIVPRTMIGEVAERIDHAGKVLLPLDDHAARKVVQGLIDRGAQAIAVCLLWSFQNRAHEQRVGDIIRELVGDKVAVSLSCDTSPKMGEYERTATTVLNAYLRKTTQSYFEQVEEMLLKRGFRGAFTVLNSSGGVIPASEAGIRAVGMLLSGPAGGVTGSSYLAESLGHQNVITTDMGGTSFDVSLIVNSRPVIAPVNEVGGYHINMPMINIAAIGAGGGSIASVHNGQIQVGPESAGAKPGPACYGRGGKRPTVTDADLVLGIIDPDRFLGGRMKLDREAAERAIREHVADPLHLGLHEAADGIRRIVDSHMADTLRELTLGHGHDPRDFALYAYGGAGPMHCASYGREAGVREVIIPRTSMVHSAYGALASDLLYSAERTLILRGRASGEDLDHERMSGEFCRLEQQCVAMLTKSGVAAEDRVLQRFVDMRYAMQTHSLIVPLPGTQIDEGTMRTLAARFHQIYEDTYGKGAGYTEAGVEVEAIRVEARGRTRKPQIGTVAQGTGESRHVRLVYDGRTKKQMPTSIIQWDDMRIGETVIGPAIIEHPTTTVVVGPGQNATLDDYGNLILREIRSAA